MNSVHGNTVRFRSCRAGERRLPFVLTRVADTEPIDRAQYNRLLAIGIKDHAASFKRIGDSNHRRNQPIA